MNLEGSSIVWVHDVVWLAALIAAIAAGALLLSPRLKSAQARRTLWQACLLASLACILVQLSGVGREAAALANRPTQKPKSVITASVPPEPDETSTISSDGSSLQFPVAASRKSAVPSAVVEMRRSYETPLQGMVVFAGLWMIGTALLSLRLALVRIIFLWCRSRGRAVEDADLREQVDQFARQLGIQGKVRVVEFSRLETPIAFGFFGPTIGVPPHFAQQFSVSQRNVMLAHELMHLVARDGFWYLLADFTAALLWWHPAVWWLRRRLHHASEVAADEASLLVEGGPAILAECLVRMGERLAPARFLASTSVSGFRSGLGRRIGALLDLKSNVWHGHRRRSFMRIFVPAAIVPVFVICSAFTSQHPSTIGDSMKGPTWKKSLPGFALLALLGSGGELTGAEQSVKPTVPPKIENRPTETRKWSGIHKIREKLGQIILEQVRYDGLPLGEVIRQLIEESRHRDPEKIGINFLLINSTLPSTIIDPATGLPVPQEPVDLGSTTVRIDPGLKNVRLLDALDAIIKVADRPLRYTIQDYGVVFSLDPAPGFTETLVTETFQVQAEIFFKGIESAFGIEVPFDVTSGSTPRSTVVQLWALKLKQAEDDLKETKKLADGSLVSSTELRRAENAVETARLQLAAKEEEAQKRGNMPLPNRETQQRIFRDLFSQLGVRLDPPRTAFFNELTGIIMVRVNPSEMEAVRAAIETLGGTPTSKLATSNFGKAQ